MQEMNNIPKLFELASAAMKNAYVPYSRFAVGAAVLSSDGRFYAGCNVENVSYPCGSCAETGAIAAMIAGGSREIAEILILGSGKELISPCGACRQRIKEFSVPQTLVHLADASGVRRTCTAAELLPFAFDEKDLAK